jgi:hypothetical protein
MNFHAHRHGAAHGATHIEGYGDDGFLGRDAVDGGGLARFFRLDIGLNVPNGFAGFLIEGNALTCAEKSENGIVA